MAQVIRSPHIIWTMEALREYIGGLSGKAISIARFNKLVERGLPVTIIDGSWCGHAENIEQFMKAGTRTPPRSRDIEAE